MLMSNYFNKGDVNMPFILGQDRNRLNLFPNTLVDYVSDDNPVRVIDDM